MSGSGGVCAGLLQVYQNVEKAKEEGCNMSFCGENRTNGGVGMVGRGTTIVNGNGRKVWGWEYVCVVEGSLA